jgi:hypothetical protein
MTNLSPKIEIITHFDELINNVDIDCETSIQKYKEKQVLSQLYSKDDNEKYWKKVRFKLGFTSESFHNNEETSVIEYLKHVRKKAIKELRQTQKDSLDYYKLNYLRLESKLADVKDKEELRSILFADKFHFQVRFNQSNKRLWIFDIFTFITDFYLPEADIELLE